MRRTGPDLRYPLALLAAFALLWSILAVAPFDRGTWIVENILVVALVPLLALTARSYRFSNLAYTLLFGFLTLHTIGAHYTYGKVPIPLDILDPSRNAFDRVVHFAFGALFVVPLHELHRDVVRARGAWPRILAVETILAASALYEVGEWLVTVLAPPATGAAFLATQGDPFDSFKDVGLAGLGAALTMAINAAGRHVATRPEPYQDASKHPRTALHVQMAAVGRRSRRRAIRRGPPADGTPSRRAP